MTVTRLLDHVLETTMKIKLLRASAEANIWHQLINFLLLKYCALFVPVDGETDWQKA